MKDVLFFDAMLTPKIITGVYWLLMLGVVIGSLATMFTSGFWAGLGALVGGVIGVRIWCELLIVMFKIHENLKKIADNQA